MLCIRKMITPKVYPIFRPNAMGSFQAGRILALKDPPEGRSFKLLGDSYIDVVVSIETQVIPEVSIVMVSVAVLFVSSDSSM